VAFGGMTFYVELTTRSACASWLQRLNDVTEPRPIMLSASIFRHASWIISLLSMNHTLRRVRGACGSSNPPLGKCAHTGETGWSSPSQRCHTRQSVLRGSFTGLA
jgi:hypothetical protein